LENLGPRMGQTRGPQPRPSSRPHRHRPPRPAHRHPAGFPRGFTPVTHECDRSNSPTRRARGGADPSRPRPLAGGQSGGPPGGGAGSDPRAAARRASRCSLTIRWLVTQASQPSKCGSGTILFSTDSGPLRIARSLPEAVGRRVARRRGPTNQGTDPPESVVAIGVPSRRARARRPDRRGQAPKGTGGMPRRHQEYGRGRLRKVRGSCRTSVDPGMPAETRGTETSQYPEEEKATATPSVAASERGPA
jgi:hypothetical protein